jgi:hypothetical protein
VPELNALNGMGRFILPTSHRLSPRKPLLRVTNRKVVSLLEPAFGIEPKRSGYKAIQSISHPDGSWLLATFNFTSTSVNSEHGIGKRKRGPQLGVPRNFA